MRPRSGRAALILAAVIFVVMMAMLDRAGALLSTVYYVDPAGNDACNGLGPGLGAVNPCAMKKPQTPLSVVQCGDVVQLAAGTFTDTTHTVTWSDPWATEWPSEHVFMHLDNVFRSGFTCAAGQEITIRGMLDAGGQWLTTLDGAGVMKRGAIFYDFGGLIIRDTKWQGFVGDAVRGNQACTLNSQCSPTCCTGQTNCSAGVPGFCQMRTTSTILCQPGNAGRPCDRFTYLHNFNDDVAVEGIADSGGEVVWSRSSNGYIAYNRVNAGAPNGILVWTCNNWTAEFNEVRRKRIDVLRTGTARDAGETINFGIKFSNDWTFAGNYLLTDLNSCVGASCTPCAAAGTCYNSLAQSFGMLSLVRSSERGKLYRNVLENGWGNAGGIGFRIQQDTCNAGNSNTQCDAGGYGGVGSGLQCGCFEQHKFRNDLYINTQASSVVNEYFFIGGATACNGCEESNNLIGRLTGTARDVKGFGFGGGQQGDPLDQTQSHMVASANGWLNGTGFGSLSVLWENTPTSADCPTSGHPCVQSIDPTLPSTNDVRGNPQFKLTGAKPDPSNNASFGTYFQIQASGVMDNAGDNARCADPQPADGLCDIGPFEISGAAAQTWTYTSSVTGGGFGLVTTDVGGVSCPPSCVSSARPDGSTLLATATADQVGPSTFSVFNGFSGTGCGTTSPATVTMDSNKSCLATFTFHCSDGVTDSNETCQDGGGYCRSALGQKCANGTGCAADADCISANCNLTSHLCEALPAPPGTIKVVGGKSAGGKIH